MTDILDLYPDRIMPEPNSGCWLWTGAYDGGFGYGKIYRNKRATYAHRKSFEIHAGRSLPKALKVLHRCDVPACVNPHHLFLGTQADNVADCAAKGRRVGQRNPDELRGINHPMAKLSEAQARQVIADRAAGMTLTAISALREIPYAAVCHISSGRTWAHLRKIEGAA